MPVRRRSWPLLCQKGKQAHRAAAAIPLACRHPRELAWARFSSLNASYEPLNITTWRRRHGDGAQGQGRRAWSTTRRARSATRPASAHRDPPASVRAGALSAVAADTGAICFSATATAVSTAVPPRSPCRSTMWCPAAAAVATAGTTSPRPACPATCARATALPARRACPCGAQPHRPLSTLSFEAARQMRRRSQRRMGQVRDG
jgi:hypothetical protein